MKIKSLPPVTKKNLRDYSISLGSSILIGLISVLSFRKEYKKMKPGRGYC